MKKIYKLILCAFVCASIMFTCSAAISAAPKIAKVKNVKVTSVAANKISLKWKKISGVTGYRVYRYNSKKEKYVYVGKTKKVTYTDSKSLSAGTVYKYKVRAYKTKNDKNTYGEYSNGGRRKYFSLTDLGRKVTEQNLSEWEFSRTIIDSLISDGESHYDFSFITENTSSGVISLPISLKNSTVSSRDIFIASISVIDCS